MNKIRNLKLFSLVCILAFALVFIGFLFLQAQGNSKKDKPPGKPKPPPPELSLDYRDIVTTGENALSVWNFKVDDPIWSTETPGYRSVAVGDVDGDNMKEIVVPGYKEVKVGKGKEAQSYLKIFLNVYKEGVSGIWKSTEDYVREEDLGIIHEIMIADVYSDPGNKIILLTDHNLAVFEYDGENFKIVHTKHSSEIGSSEEFFAVTVGDIDAISDGNEILVSAYKKESEQARGCVYILDEELNPLNNPSPNPLYSTIDGEIDVSFLSHRSLRVADLDDDDSLEICTTGYYSPGSENGVLWQAFVFVWDLVDDSWQTKSHYIPGWASPVNMFPYLHLDVGELDGSEKIVVSANSGYSDYFLYLYSYNNDLFLSYLTGGDFGLPLPDARVSDVEVEDVCTSCEGDEIVVAGRVSLPGGAVFYLEVFDSKLNTLWERIGEKKEGRIIDTAIVK